jgi:PilZ domain-containing protein
VAEPEEKRSEAGALRLRKFIEVVIEDKRSSMLFRAAIADVSTTGMRVVCDQYLPKDSRYTFTFKRAPFLTVLGEVRWVRSFERDTFQVGVLFVELGDDARQRLQTFIAIERLRVPTS